MLPFPWNGGIRRLEEKKKKKKKRTENPERGVNGQPIESKKIGYPFLYAPYLSNFIPDQIEIPIREISGRRPN